MQDIITLNDICTTMLVVYVIYLNGRIARMHKQTRNMFIVAFRKAADKLAESNKEQAMLTHASLTISMNKAMDDAHDLITNYMSELRKDMEKDTKPD